MKKESICKITETLAEAFVGGAMGITIRRTILPKCDKYERLIVCIGSLIVGGMIGRSFGERFYEMCDDIVGTNFYEKNNL
nr:MAG TPA: hypothetical protein [Caudoviricetes sp.]